ncbi:hypothetical protein D4R86_03920 [bacterium]|nr:MAG: hypothetical protein D4R86_03920 [bacterium]
MSREIKTINIDTSLVVSSRNITVDDSIRSIDVNQTDGTILVTYPQGSDGSYDGSVIVYPQSSALQVNSGVEIQDLGSFGSLNYPNDAKFNYLRRKIWICDSGNHRVIKLDRDTQEVDISIEDEMYYPYSMVVNFNDGSVFVRGYSDIGRFKSVIMKFNSNGDTMGTFEFDTDPTDESSSSDSLSSSSSNPYVPSSSSSSSNDVFPILPLVNTIVYDHVRSKLWWTNKRQIYMANERNKSLQIYNVDDAYFNTYAIDVELSSGNAFVVVGDNHDERFLIQMYKDNSLLLGTAYIG